MQLIKKWVAGVLTMMLLLSVAIVGCNDENKKEEANNEQNQMQQFKPLSTESKKVMAEYKGGKVIEGDLNRYINIIAFLDPQLAYMLASAEGNTELRVELAKEYASRQYMLTQIKNDSSYVKQADQTLKELDASIKGNAAQAQAQGQDTPKSLEEAIKGKGFTSDELRQFFIEYHRVNRYYDDQLKGKTYDYVKVQHILVAINDGSQQDQPKRTADDAKKRAEEVKKKLNAGEDFSKLVKEYTDDPGSKETNGIYEGTPDQFVPEFAKACRELPLNQVSAPIKTDYGYHIVKVLDRGQKPVEKANEQVKMQKRQEVYEQVVKEKLEFKSLLSVPQKG
ncbi:peptidylprolyl isomerase [Thermoactinomyces mirandus]|uniref:Peptidylprolyl isomerase n=1 Tax=Thermoactinomyces mirandus TaxID=2756294 RepID=A0A7W2AQ88_9BACL|nr:peptidylprolyl isomerase [Thermoactinomyces mirandus]MBA4601253.1 peptidylprolyl isomerase [Thermoactinomyces mirandus]